MSLKKGKRFLFLRSKRLLTLHILVGSFFYFPMVIVTVTGMILGFHDWILFAQPPYRIPSISGQTTTPRMDDYFSNRHIGQTVKMVEAAYPEMAIQAIYLPLSVDHPLKIHLSDFQKSSSLYLFLNSATGKILAKQNLMKPKYLNLIYEIHRGTWGGTAGKVFHSLIGLAVFLVGISGYFIYWRRSRNSLSGKPRRAEACVRKCEYKYKRSRLFQLIQLHRKFGYYFGALLCLIAISGALMNFYSLMIKFFDPVPASTAVSGPSNMPGPLTKSTFSNIEKNLATAKAVRANTEVQSIHALKDFPALILFYFQDNSRVYINTVSNQVEKVMSPESHWIHALYPFHSGRIFGKGHWVFISVAGLSTLILMTAGFLTCLKRPKF